MSMHREDYLNSLKSVVDYFNEHRRLTLGLACFFAGIALAAWLL